MGKNLQWTDSRQRLPEDRENAPDHVGANTEGNPAIHPGIQTGQSGSPGADGPELALVSTVLVGQHKLKRPPVARRISDLHYE